MHFKLFLKVLTGVSALSILTYASHINKNISTQDCLNFKIEAHTLYRFVDPGHYKGLKQLYDAICNRIKEGKWDKAKGNEVMHSLITRCAICRENKINPDFEQYLTKEKEMPESVVFAYKQFCLDTYDPSKWAGIKKKVLKSRMKWLKNEFFCQWTHEIASPSGFWINLFKPDLPSIKKFEERTDLICQELRDGKIDFNEANYRWQQELIEAQKMLAPETVKEMGNSLKKPLEILIDMFKGLAN